MSGYGMPIPRAFVLGHPVAHSRSPMLHGYWLRSLRVAGAYDLQDVAPGGLGAFFAAMRYRGYVGGNVTVPHKVAVMDFMDRLDDTARDIGAVNTIWIEDGELVGGNTDALGTIANLDDRAPAWDAHPGTAVMLGAGGAARAAIYGLLQRGFKVQIVNRTPSHAADLAHNFGPRVTAHEMAALPLLLPGADLLINTSALGMTGKPPLVIDLAPLNRAAVVCDIVYVPLETPLLQDAAARGHRIVSGLGMLLHQAVAGFAHWFGATPSVTQELRELIEADIRAKTPPV